MTTRQTWCTVQLYNPTVIRHGGVYKMWYLGNSSATRTDDTQLGLAVSSDGIQWREHPANPISCGGNLPSAGGWQTPHVLYDEDEELLKMWFVSGRAERDEAGGLVSMTQELAYATSRDGLGWDVRPEPLYPSGRRPCVIKDAPGGYRMWMGSAADPEDLQDTQAIYKSIYRFESADGIHWCRDAQPVVTANDKLKSVVYPFVLQADEGYVMWYASHVEGGLFEIFCSTSTDGLTWAHHHDRPAFPATRDPSDFDGRYTSTPCVLDDGERYLLYYSTRDWGNLYGAGDGTVKVDRQGIYRHVGVAVCPKT